MEKPGADEAPAGDADKVGEEEKPAGEEASEEKPADDGAKDKEGESGQVAAKTEGESAGDQIGGEQQQTTGNTAA